MRFSFSQFGNVKRNLTLVCSAAAIAIGTGCETKSFIDPSELGRLKKDPLVLPILNSLETGIEEPVDLFADAGEITAEDLIANESDYVIGKNDLVNISVTDVQGLGVETVKSQRVSEKGFISLPLLGQLKAIGYSEAELEQVVQDAYRNANLIQNSTVSVTVVEARARTFSVIGNVGAAGQYAIIQSDFRMLDAMVLFRDVNPNSDYVYVIRKLPGAQSSGSTTQPATDVAPTPTDGEDLLAPPTDAPATQAGMDGPTTEVAQDQTEAFGIVDGKPVSMNEPESDQTMEDAATKPFAFGAIAEPADKRVIQIPIVPLKNGELKYNIVIRAGDMLVVPAPLIGEYYMGGHVARVGVYSLTGRQITLKQAVVAAGMLDSVAMPYRTDIIRRIGTNHEIWARVDLDAIYDGRQPDLFLKPNDIVHVGTNAFAPFLAAIRGGFRFSYGLGFLYDKNFSGDDNNNNN